MQNGDKLPGHYASWSIVELMGRTVVAGFAEEVDMAGSTMLRVDVPAIGDIPAWTKFYGAAAIFACTPVGEEEAMIVAAYERARPIATYILPVAKPMTMRMLEGRVMDDDRSNSADDYDGDPDRHEDDDDDDDDDNGITF